LFGRKKIEETELIKTENPFSWVSILLCLKEKRTKECRKKLSETKPFIIVKCVCGERVNEECENRAFLINFFLLFLIFLKNLYMICLFNSAAVSQKQWKFGI
jgi:hypothetical protein